METQPLNSKAIILRLRIGVLQGALLIVLGVILGAGFNVVRSTGLPWIERWSVSSVSASHLKGLQEISLEEAYSLYRQGNTVLLDARDTLSFQQGHIAGALNVPPGEAKGYLKEVLTLAKSGHEVIVYCDGVDCPLSPELARTLQRFGVPSVKVLVDGWRLWLEAGYPIEEG
ncbi:MAG: hypothetical protein A2Y65_06855 [Deltaproteobacteria bacterium RBG_13_52_11]|nr:MAG: hypothetical protein A2Y65_06855 [Deltaproteobacteria bacterium RBG_13_52_11]